MMLSSRISTAAELDRDAARLSLGMVVEGYLCYS